MPEELAPIVDVMEYLEYREFLRDWYKSRKRVTRGITYRFLSQKVGVDSAWLVRIFRGQGHLADEAVPAFIRMCKLDSRQAEYFKALHRFCKTPSDVERRHCFDEMMRLRDLDSRRIGKEEFEYFSSWIPSALRALIGLLQDTSSPERLAELLSPPISSEGAVSSTMILERLGLLVPDGNGGWNITERILTTGAEVGSKALRNYHRQILCLAEESLDRHPAYERDISTLILTLSVDDLPEVKERITQLRRGLLHLAKSAAKADRVFAMNISLFPLSDRLDARELVQDPPEGAKP